MLSLLRKTIEYYVKDDKQKINLIVHDWGSYFGILYENHYKDSVERLVLLDIGVGINENIFTYLVLIFYQSYFAISYILRYCYYYHYCHCNYCHYHYCHYHYCHYHYFHYHYFHYHYYH